MANSSQTRSGGRRRPLRIAWSVGLGRLPVEPEAAQVHARGHEAWCVEAVIVDAETVLADAGEAFLILRSVMIRKSVSEEQDLPVGGESAITLANLESKASDEESGEC
jgi:hypothetical protein